LEEFDLKETSPVIDFFEAFITNDLVGKIVFETNRYAKEQPINSEHSRMVYWKDTSVEELYIFLGVTILMARNKKLQISEYWSTNDLLHQDIFGKYMSRDRYLLLLHCIHFCKNPFKSKEIGSTKFKWF